jgi:hypothetical protein
MYGAGKVSTGACSHLRAQTWQSRICNEREITMVENRSFITLSLAAAALGILGAASAVAPELGGRGDRGGYVVPGSLVGVNPVYHPDIFGNPATAYAYGFVRSQDGTWHVRSDWGGEVINGPGTRAFGSAIGATKHRAGYDRR